METYPVPKAATLVGLFGKPFCTRPDRSPASRVFGQALDQSPLITANLWPLSKPNLPEIAVPTVSTILRSDVSLTPTRTMHSLHL